MYIYISGMVCGSDASRSRRYGPCQPGERHMQHDEVTISLSITPTWSILREVRDKAESFMKQKGAAHDVVESTIMCAVELVENSIKYGSSAAGTATIHFDLGADSDRVRIMVSNGVRDEDDALRVRTNIERIKSSDDPGALYTERLQQLMEDPRPGESQLGLYRIAYEGEFTLDCTYRDGILTVLAERTYE